MTQIRNFMSATQHTYNTSNSLEREFPLPTDRNDSSNSIRESPIDTYTGSEISERVKNAVLAAEKREEAKVEKTIRDAKNHIEEHNVNLMNKKLSSGSVEGVSDSEDNTLRVVNDILEKKAPSPSIDQPNTPATVKAHSPFAPERTGSINGQVERPPIEPEGSSGSTNFLFDGPLDHDDGMSRSLPGSNPLRVVPPPLLASHVHKDSMELYTTGALAPADGPMSPPGQASHSNSEGHNSADGDSHSASIASFVRGTSKRALADTKGAIKGISMTAKEGVSVTKSSIGKIVKAVTPSAVRRHSNADRANQSSENVVDDRGLSPPSARKMTI